MLFQNRKFRIIFASAYYAAFLLAAIIIFMTGVSDMQKANENNLMVLLVGIFVNAVPYLHFLSLSRDDDGDAAAVGKKVAGIAGHVLTYGGCLILALCATNYRDYTVLSLSGILSSVAALVLYYLNSYLKEDAYGELAAFPVNLFYILIFLTPFLSYLAVFVLTKLLSVQLTLTVIGAVAASGLIFTVGGKGIIGKIGGGALILVYLLASVVMGSMPKSNGLNYANPADTLIFAPLLATVIAVLATVSFFKNKLENPIYVGVSRSLLVFAAPILQYVIGVKWFVGVPVTLGALLAVFILDGVFKPARVKDRETKERRERLAASGGSRGGDSVGLGRDIADMLGNKFSGYDYADVYVSGRPPRATVNITVHYAHEIHSSGNWYRNDIMHWVKSYLQNRNTGYSGYDINVNFTDDF